MKPILETTAEDLRGPLEVSVFGAATAVHTVLEPMRKAGRGTILFTTGTAFITRNPQRAGVGVSFSGEVAYAEMLHKALAEEGIHVAHTAIHGAIGPGKQFEPDAVADILWQHHTAREGFQTRLGIDGDEPPLRWIAGRSSGGPAPACAPAPRCELAHDAAGRASIDTDHERKDTVVRGAMMYGPGDVRVEERDAPEIVEPTDAIIRVSAACVCGSDLWPYRGIETEGERADADGARVRRDRRGGRQRGHDDHAGPVRGRVVLGVRQHLRDLPGRLPERLRPRAPGSARAQAELLRVPLADGTLVATPDVPSDDLLPSLLAASDVLGTGWFGAVAAEAGPGQDGRRRR